jgi:hypothetical protein
MIEKRSNRDTSQGGSVEAASSVAEILAHRLEVEEDACVREEFSPSLSSRVHRGYDLLLLDILPT